MASRSWQEEIRNGRFNFNMIQLPPDRKKALDKLEYHIKTVIDTYEQMNNQSVTCFYIGKSSVPCSKRLKFDIDNPHDTWELKRIQSRWHDHKRKDYTTMVVIAVITDDTLPEGIDKTQKYCLSLESWLINRFTFEIMDKRITNDSSNAGREASECDTIVYVLYVVMKLKHPPHEHVSRSPSRRKNCGNCNGCLAENCGHCEYCKDMPKFGGPGIKKQRCIRRQCLFPLQSPLESSWQQFNETERNVVSNKIHEKRTLKSVKDASRNNNDGDSEMVANRPTAHVDSRNESKFHQLQSSLHAHGSPKLTKVYKHEQKYTLKCSSDKFEICPGGSRQTDNNDRQCHSMSMDHGSNRKQHHNSPKPNLPHAQESSVSHSNNVPASRFTSLNGRGGREMTIDKHTVCEDDGNNTKVAKFGYQYEMAKSSHGSLQSSRPMSTITHRYTQESTSRRMHGNYMHIHDRERITEGHQHNHSRIHERSMELQARMQNIDGARKVEAHTFPMNLGRKRSSSYAGMQLSESQLKRRKMDHNNSSVVGPGTPSHTNRARESEHSHYTFKHRDRPRPGQTKWSRQYKIPLKMDMGKRMAAHTIPNNASRQQSSRNPNNMPLIGSQYERHKIDHTKSTSRIVTSLHPSNRGVKSGHNSRRIQSHRTSSVVSEPPAKLEQNGDKSRNECIKLLQKIESMQTEEMSQWFDALPPENEVKLRNY